jgi:chromosome segregation ATPase
VPNAVHGISELCAQVESVDANLKEMDTRIRQLRINAAAMALGVELHQKRGQLTKQWEHLEKQRDDLTQQIQTLEGGLKELKREETNQTVLANKARQGQTLIAMAVRYREAATEIRACAAWCPRCSSKRRKSTLRLCASRIARCSPWSSCVKGGLG